MNPWFNKSFVAQSTGLFFASIPGAHVCRVRPISQFLFISEARGSSREAGFVGMYFAPQGAFLYNKLFEMPQRVRGPLACRERTVNIA